MSGSVVETANSDLTRATEKQLVKFLDLRLRKTVYCEWAYFKWATEFLPEH